jgi:translation initiation factor 4A
MEQTELREYTSFADMELPDELLRGIYSVGFEQPSVIQRRAIVPIKEGRDVLGQAQSGTGKTGTFTIGTLARVDPTIPHVQVLVLVPTHELADQHFNCAKNIGKYMRIKVHYAIGGGEDRPVSEDIKAIQDGCQFLIGTPGRIYDLCHRGVLRRDHIRNLVMDEADQMLDHKFKQQVMAILDYGFPTTTRVALISATMTDDFLALSDNLLQQPVRVLIKPEEVPLDGIKQYFVDLEHDEWKFDTLIDIYKQIHITQAIIYCNKQARADWLAMKMKENKLTVECFHGGMSVAERKQRMAEFRNGGCRVLISTDLTARGIDVQQVSTVINFELPLDKAQYIHRIGRCGRYGKKGLVLNLIGPSDRRMRQDIESHFVTNMIAVPEDLTKMKI